MNVGDSYAHTTDTRLASALSAVGVKFYHPEPFTHLEQDGKEWVRWNFETASSCGLYNTYDLMKAWEREDDWLEDNEGHPFAIAMVALHTREHLVKGIKQNNPNVVIKTSQGTWTVPKNGTFHKKLTK